MGLFGGAGSPCGCGAARHGGVASPRYLMWQQKQRIAEEEEIDAKLLAADLPPTLHRRASIMAEEAQRGEVMARAMLFLVALGARAMLFLVALCVAAGAAAQQPPAKPPANKPPAAAKSSSRPAWAALTVDQQMILAPLKADWESLDPERRRLAA